MVARMIAARRTELNCPTNNMRMMKPAMGSFSAMD